MSLLKDSFSNAVVGEQAWGIRVAFFSRALQGGHKGATCWELPGVTPEAPHTGIIIP